MSRKTLAQVLGKSVRRRYDDCGISWVDSKQLIGIEIEAENLSGVILPSQDELSGLWNAKADGSLRNGIEYVLSRPMAGSELATAIEVFFESARTKKAMTSGTHIHVDMLDPDKNATCAQALFLLVYIIEPAMYAIIDAGREWCGFTNSLQEAPPKLIHAMLSDGVEDNPRKLVDIVKRGRELKYYGLNFQPLSVYGSVEFRYFPTAESKEELVGWVNFVQTIVKSAKELDTKENVESLLSCQELYEQYINNTFTDKANKILEVVPYDVAKKRLMQAKLNHAMTHAPAEYQGAFPEQTLCIRRFSRYFSEAQTRHRRDETNGSISIPKLRVFVSLTEGISSLWQRVQREQLHKNGDIFITYDALMMYTHMGMFNLNGHEMLYLIQDGENGRKYHSIAKSPASVLNKINRAIAQQVAILHQNGRSVPADKQARVNQRVREFEESLQQARDHIEANQNTNEDNE